MVETYGIDQMHLFYIDEITPGTTPSNPAMLSVPIEDLNPGFDPGNLLLRAAGSSDLMAIKKGLWKPEINFKYVLPSASPINLLQYANKTLDKSLSIQVLYHKSLFSTATDILSLLYTYMRLNRVTVSCEIDDVVRVQVNAIGQGLTTDTSKISGATYTDYTGAVAFNETDFSIDAVANSRVVGWRFDINNNVRQIPVLRATNGHLAKYVPFGSRTLSGEVRFEFEAKTELEDALADTERILQFGLGGTAYTQFSGCRWSSIQTEKLQEDLIAMRAAFDAKSLTIAAS